MSVSVKENLQRWLKEEELLLLGITNLEIDQAFKYYQNWLSEGKHAEMAYLENHLEVRENPRQLLEHAKSAIIVGLPYSQENSLEGEPKVAQYARFQDYHVLLRKKLNPLVEKLQNLFPNDRFRITVDSAPLLEKALAEKSELGFLGKNTCYIHPMYGSFLLLSEILTTASLSYDEKAPLSKDRKSKAGGCGPCTRCQDLCPTGALSVDYQIDSRKCISYWTIEHRGPIPREYWPHLAKYYFGCDICQLVCPYNGKEDQPMLPASIPRRCYPGLFETATMDQAGYEQYFGGTPLTRAKKDGLRRNALIALFVTNHPKLPEALALCEKDAESPVRETITEIKKG